MAQPPTLHDQIVALLGLTVEVLEHSGSLPPFAVISRPIIECIRREQSYDPDVLALLDRLEAALEEE